ncbi:MAG: hypothetical protein HWN66_07475 [Candidatus Helarchaeota archaeon]|nr:hypothetical protein [Candidatus Helarchaeota archaeon]
MKEFRFKILVLGTSDKLRSEFLGLISQKSWRIDGVSGHFHSTNGVVIDIWFPRENSSSKILASFSYSDANGVIIVMGRRDRRALQRMKRIIHKRVGKVPFVAFVLRKYMSDGERAMKSLHAVRLLSEKMKEVSLQIKVEIPSKKEGLTPTEVAGRPAYRVDKYGFVVLDSSEGIPLFVDTPEQKSKLKKP